MDEIIQYLNLQTVDILCSNCGVDVAVKIIILREESHFICPCGTSIPTRPFVKALNEAEIIVKKTLPGFRCL